MTTELFRCHVIAQEFKLDPHEIYEKWDALQVAETYSYLKVADEKFKKDMKEKEKKGRRGRR